MNVTDVDDEYLKLASEGVQKITDAALPGKFWVEFAPIFRHVPGWIPGASFKRYVKDVNPKIDELLGRPFEAVKRDWVRSYSFHGVREPPADDYQKAAGNAGPCITTTLINKLHENDGGNLYEKEGDIRNIVGVSYAGKRVGPLLNHAFLTLRLAGVDTVNDPSESFVTWLTFYGRLQLRFNRSSSRCRFIPMFKRKHRESWIVLWAQTDCPLLTITTV